MPYPALPVHGDFQPVDETRNGYPKVKPDAVPDRILRARVPVNDSWRTKAKKKLARTKLRPTQSPFHGVTRINLLCDDEVSESFNQGSWSTKDPAEAFCFAPGKDDPKIGWKLRREEEVESVAIELMCSDTNGDAVVIHSKVLYPDAFKKDPLQHKSAKKTDRLGVDRKLQWTGTMKLSDYVTASDLKAAKLDGDDAPFAGGVLTAQYSPYKLRLVVHSKPGKEGACWNPIAWTYLHVVIAEVRLGWFPLEDLDAFFPSGTQAEQDELARIKAVYADLLDKKDASNLKGNFPSRDRGDTKRVYLRSNRFYPSNESLTSNWSFEQLKELWGAGVQIPILADAGYIRRANGKVASVPEAVGKMPFVWDYVDRARGSATATSPFYKASGTWPYAEPDIVEVVTGAARPNVTQFLDTTMDYKTDETTVSPAGRNCHRDRGGKRGNAAAPIFPANDGSRFPFKVRRLTGTAREWLSVSTLESTDKKYLGKTGILFQPSRIAGDGYELHVYPGHKDDGVNVALSQGGQPIGMSGRFQVWRRVDLLRYVVLSDPAVEDQNTPTKSYRDWIEKVRQKFAQFYVDLRPAYKAIEEGKKARRAFNDSVHANLNGWTGDGVAPDWMLAAFKVPAANTPAADYPLEVETYAAWRQKMMTAHGANSDAQLYAWARTGRQLFADASGKEADFSIWNESGSSPLSEPHPLTWQPYAYDAEITKLEVRCPDLDGEAAPTPPPPQGGLPPPPPPPPGPRRTLTLALSVIPGPPPPPNSPPNTPGGAPTLPADWRTQVKTWVTTTFLDKAMQRAEGAGALRAFDPAIHPADIKLTLAAGKNDAHHTAALDQIKTEIEAAWTQLFFEASERRYWRSVGYGWGYNVIAVLMNKKLRAPGEEGVVLLQGRLFPKNRPGTAIAIETPNGKSEACQGDRATAVNWFLSGCREVVTTKTTYSKTRMDEHGNPAIAVQGSVSYPAGTLLHETGHFLGIGHQGGASEQECRSDPRDLHQREPLPDGLRVLNTTGSTLDSDFCATSMLRMRGWSIYGVDDAGAYSAPQNLTVGAIDTSMTKGGPVVKNGDKVDYRAPSWAGKTEAKKEREDVLTYELTGTVPETGMTVRTKVIVNITISDTFPANVATHDSAKVKPAGTVSIPAITDGKSPALGSRTIWHREAANRFPDPTTNGAPAQPAASWAGYAETTLII